MMNTDTLRPEQQLALDYARRAGTEAPAAKIRRKLATTFAELESFLDEISADAARKKPSPDGWSIHQVVDHLVESHRPGVEELEALLRGTSPDAGPIPAGLQSERPFDVPWPEMVSRLKQVHADLLGTLDRPGDDTPLDALPLQARAAVAMVVKCRHEDGSMRPVHWEESFDWKAYAILLRAHTLEHVQQIRRLLAD